MVNRLQASNSRLRLALGDIPRSILLHVLRAYKFAISPLLLPACRYVPTCSEYAAEAIERYGAVRGTALAMWRLLRCHPFTRGGFDPVPMTTTPIDPHWQARTPAVPFSNRCSRGH